LVCKKFTALAFRPPLGVDPLNAVSLCSTFVYSPETGGMLSLV